MPDKKNNLKEKDKKDKLIKIGDFQDKKSTLIYSIFISKPLFDETRIHQDKENIYSFSFEKLKIIVLTSFLYVPTYSESDLYMTISSNPRFDKEKIGEKFSLELKSLEYSDLLKSHSNVVFILRDCLLARLKKNFQKIQTPLPL